ncbi:MAG: hydantoinase/oxoprolinase family protein [Actinobacteria bacterium]|nr:hydantoinase/oxoprolinase family protein [Actinomycetota bacterium]
MVANALGVDVGGTFTDFAAWDGTRLVAGKTSTTADQSDGVIDGSRRIIHGPADILLHGTTIATNALLERKGARTALVTSAGFTDVIEIGRQDRPSLYDAFKDRPEPLVPRSLRLPDGGDLAALADVEAIAVALLWSFRHPGEEEQILEKIRSIAPDVPVSLSSRVAPEFREFERTSTTVLNAYLSPVVGRYLQHLETKARQAGLPDDILVMRSSGGLMDLAAAIELPAAVLLSGPAGGVVASAELGKALGHDTLISFDMGGTSTDVCRVEHGRPESAYRRSIEGYPCLLPSVAVHTVGAGGGSVAWVDSGGALRVGPRSAGAVPGPASYGRGGTEATVSDADLMIGRLAKHLAGGMALRHDLAEGAVQRTARLLDLSSEATALGIVEVVEAHMERAVRAVSVEEGADPRSSVLVAFGGAGGMHATALARRLDMAGVVVPPHAGVFSALGLLLSPPRVDLSLSLGPEAVVDEAVGHLRADAAHHLVSETGAFLVEVRTSVDVRYRGQSHETTVPYRPGEGTEVLEARFHDAHRARNGFARVGDPVEVVTVRAAALGTPALRWSDLDDAVPEGEAARGTREVLTSDGAVDADVWWRPGLAPGTTVEGPAVIEEPDATVFLGIGERATVHPCGALEVEW